LDDLSMDECEKAMTNKLEDINKGGPSVVIACFRGRAHFDSLAHRDLEQGKTIDERLVLGDELSSWRLIGGGNAIDDEARAIGRRRCIAIREPFASGTFPRVGPSSNSQDAWQCGHSG
jgi:hypothetical protein